MALNGVIEIFCVFTGVLIIKDGHIHLSKLNPLNTSDLCILLHV